MAPKLADVPARLGGFDFIKIALIRVFDAEQLDVMCPTQEKWR